MARLRYLTRDDVEFIAHRLAEKLFTNYEEPMPAFQLFGGVREGGALLESALGLPRQPYYRTLHDKAGALLRSLIKNHPLVDGNKRVGMTATFVFLGLNRHVLVASNEEMVQFALAIAASKPDMSWKEIAAWLKIRTVKATMPHDLVVGRLWQLLGKWDPAALEARLLQYGKAYRSLADESSGR